MTIHSNVDFNGEMVEDRQGPRGRACPNYVPEWEIIQVEGEWYHLDGMKLDPEIEFMPNSEFEEEERLVPYSLLTWRDKPWISTHLSGLNDQREYLTIRFIRGHSLTTLKRHKLYLSYYRSTAGISKSMMPRLSPLTAARTEGATRIKRSRSLCGRVCTVISGTFILIAEAVARLQTVSNRNGVLFRLGPDKRWLVFSAWKSGRLYGATDGAYLEEVAFTMSFYPPNAILQDGSNELSTAASYFRFGSPCFDAVDIHNESQPALEYGGHLAPLRLITVALKDAAHSWEGIADHLTLHINQRGAIFDPDLHDRLLFDDNIFSRSRLYFWAIDSLELFIPNGRIWHSRHILLRITRNDDRPGVSHTIDGLHFKLCVQRVEKQASCLVALKTRLELLRDQIKTLRDGLFNANAVIESRSATELGQNVKLSTFCAAAWAVDYSSDTVVFIVVTVLLSTVTYLTVLNANNLARLSKGLYRQSCKDILRSMMKDDEWATMAGKFGRFQPEREDNTPLQWYILKFLVSQMWKRITGARINYEADVPEWNKVVSNGITAIPN
ncbi:conserved hypothetical protein [Talaromyces stipitatus ATCC 10500]|uniref:Uncharacterized protein n=1 Tax=Talaromyces stipitatus (strain ATCC 10500 / CBS 375.48 / QM 6759 / NRRL 1006) TaxID=441959 RepID=B8MGV9_TALSN|nr:uncharacterized protein TSTA_014310 [Talaromyces stipitatus ATCC 10500]EED16340.1 conserved hypothetical protein [Talaromyces stipitatus ATCC 10500]